MAKMMRCRDVGPDCDFVARGQNEEEVMRQVVTHARTAHGIDPVPPDLARKAQGAIREDSPRN